MVFCLIVVLLTTSPYASVSSSQNSPKCQGSLYSITLNSEATHLSEEVDISLLFHENRMVKIMFILIPPTDGMLG